MPEFYFLGSSSGTPYIQKKQFFLMTSAQLSWNCRQNVAKILRHLRFAADFSKKCVMIQQSGFESPHKWSIPEGKKFFNFSFFIFYCIFEFFGTRGVHCMYAWKCFFCPKNRFFSEFFWNVDKMLFVICHSISNCRKKRQFQLRCPDSHVFFEIWWHLAKITTCWQQVYDFSD